MTTIAMVPDNPRGSPTTFRAVAGEAQSDGATVGQALDALRAQLGSPEQTILIERQRRSIERAGGRREEAAFFFAPHDLSRSEGRVG